MKAPSTMQYAGKIKNGVFTLKTHQKFFRFKSTLRYVGEIWKRDDHWSVRFVFEENKDREIT